jgi:hypothetical protein
MREKFAPRLAELVFWCAINELISRSLPAPPLKNHRSSRDADFRYQSADASRTPFGRAADANR